MKFEVYKKGQLYSDFCLSGSYMFSGDNTALSSNSNSMTFGKGLVECTKRTSVSSGISLMWPVEGYGTTMLSTTCLPEREEPYNLNVELARAKLMEITLKLEDWAIFEENEQLIENARHAKCIFIDALKNISDPAKASELADISLQKAIMFSEKLAEKHGEVVMAARNRNRNVGKHTIGCEIDPQRMGDDRYRKWLFEMFGYVTIPISWAKIEPEMGSYDFSVIDKCLETMKGRRLAVCAGPVLRFTKSHLPDWLIEKDGEFGKIREAAYHFVGKLLERYRGYIHAWKIISGMNCENFFGFNFEQIIEMTRAACLAARSAENRSRKLVEVSQPWGEYYAVKKSSIPPFVYVDTVIQSGISFDAFGLNLQFGRNKPGMYLRDMMQVSSMLDCFSPVPKPLHVTGLEVPDRLVEPEKQLECDGSRGKNWDQDTQAHWLEAFYKIAIGKPFVNSVTYSTLADSDAMEMPGSGLLNKKLEPKKAFVTLAKIQKRIIKKA